MSKPSETPQEPIESYKGMIQTLMDGELLSHSERQRVRKVYDLAIYLGLERNCINVNGKRYNALQYAAMMNIHASMIAEKLVPEAKLSERLGSLLIVSLMVATAESMQSNWSYGAELLYLRGVRDIPMDRIEILALMAQEGTFETCKEKTQRLNGNWLAVAIYCGKYLAMYKSLPGVGEVFQEVSGDRQHVYDPAETKSMTQQGSVEYLMRTYAPACMGSENMDDVKKKIEYFLQYLASGDFYFAPASTKYHASHMHGLVWHELNVVENLIAITNAKTEREIGLCVLAGVGHDLCKESFYKPYAKNEKVYSPNGSKSDDFGKFDWQSKLGFTAEPDYPIGHGGKSVHIAVSFFGSSLPISVASAIDAHMMDNPNFDKQVAEHPLGLYLALADVIATCIDEAEAVL